MSLRFFLSIKMLNNTYLSSMFAAIFHPQWCGSYLPFSIEYKNPVLTRHKSFHCPQMV